MSFLQAALITEALFHIMETSNIERLAYHDCLLKDGVLCLPYKSPFCLESAIISCPFKSVLEATSSHSAPSLYTHGHQGNCLY